MRAWALLRRPVRRPEAVQHVFDYLRGLLAEVARTNCWQLAEHASYAHPQGTQGVLDWCLWGAEAVRDELRTVMIEHIGDPAGVLVIEETGFSKQGTHSVAVQRQPVLRHVGQDWQLPSRRLPRLRQSAGLRCALPSPPLVG